MDSNVMRSTKSTDMPLVGSLAPHPSGHPLASHHLTMPPLESFAFGRLCRDRTFSAEEYPTGDWTIDYDVENRAVRLQATASRATFPNTPFASDSIFDLLNAITTEVYIRYPVHGIVALAASPPAADQHLVFLEANCSPFFEKFFMAVDKNRLLSLNDRNEMHPVLRAACLTFRNRKDQQTFLDQCKKLHLPRCAEINLPVVKKNLYCQDNLLQLQNLYPQLCFGLAFEVQKSFSNGILDPLELCVSLKDHILRLQEDSEYDAVLIFRQFASDLDVPTFVRKRGRQRNKIFTAQHSNSPGLPDLLRNAVSEYRARLARHRNIFSPTPAVVQSYHVIVTPSSWILEGPLPDRGNGESRSLA